MESGPPFYVVIRATRRSRCCSAKEVPSFLSHFKTLSIGPAPGIEPTTSRSAVKRSTDWVNPAMVQNTEKQKVPGYVLLKSFHFNGHTKRFVHDTKKNI